MSSFVMMMITEIEIVMMVLLQNCGTTQETGTYLYLQSWPKIGAYTVVGPPKN